MGIVNEQRRLLGTGLVLRSVHIDFDGGRFQNKHAKVSGPLFRDKERLKRDISALSLGHRSLPSVFSVHALINFVCGKDFRGHRGSRSSFRYRKGKENRRTRQKDDPRGESRPVGPILRWPAHWPRHRPHRLRGHDPQGGGGPVPGPVGWPAEYWTN